MLLNAEQIEISNDVLEDISEVGSIATLNLISEEEIDENSTAQDLYAKHYSQTKNSLPNITQSLKLHCLLEYNPSEDKIKASGLEEQCHVMVTIVNYELIQLGYVKYSDTVGDIITKLKRNTTISVNGKDYFIKQVGMIANYQDFPFVCNLGCDVYG